ncbi:MAG TPA: hypothetical protein V6D05_11170 [Stenomitos sp.]
MNKTWVAILAFTAMTTACGTIPSVNQTAASVASKSGLAFSNAVIKDAGLKGNRTLAIQLADPTVSGYTSQAIVHKWVKNDIFQYEVTLKHFDDNSGSYVDFSPAVTVVVPQKGANGAMDKAVFTGLSQGMKYRTEIVAKGNNGGTAADLVLNSKVPTTADYDFTATQDVEDTLSQSVVITFDPVAFNGSANTVITGPSDGTYSNPNGTPTGSAAKVLNISTHVAINAWGWDIIGTSVSGLDMSPVMCSDNQMHKPNTFIAYPLDGSLNLSTIHASYPNWFDATTGSGNFEWWMYTGEWAQYGVHTVGVKAAYNDANGVTGYSAQQGTATF